MKSTPVQNPDQQLINYINEEIRLKTRETAQLKQDVAQTQSDKIELMRDLATYQVNFTRTNEVKSSFK